MPVAAVFQRAHQSAEVTHQRVGLYLVVGDDCAVAFTLSDDGYVGLQSVSLLDFPGSRGSIRKRF